MEDAPASKLRVFLLFAFGLALALMLVALAEFRAAARRDRFAAELPLLLRTYGNIENLRGDILASHPKLAEGYRRQDAPPDQASRVAADGAYFLCDDDLWRFRRDGPSLKNFEDLEIEVLAESGDKLFGVVWMQEDRRLARWNPQTEAFEPMAALPVPDSAAVKRLDLAPSRNVALAEWQRGRRWGFSAFDPQTGAVFFSHGDFPGLKVANCWLASDRVILCERDQKTVAALSADSKSLIWETPGSRLSMSPDKRRLVLCAWDAAVNEFNAQVHDLEIAPAWNVKLALPPAFLPRPSAGVWAPDGQRIGFLLAAPRTASPSALRKEEVWLFDLKRRGLWRIFQRDLAGGQSAGREVFWLP
jgi:hypothetical protein